MESTISTRICKKLLKWNIIAEEQEAIYQYGLELLLSSLFSAGLILMIGLICRQMLCTVTFLTVFTWIRQYNGGFHAGTYRRCQFWTTVFYAAVVLLSVYTVPPLWAYTVLGIVGGAVILIWGPIESPYKPLSMAERHKNCLAGFISFEGVLSAGFGFACFSASFSHAVYYTLVLIIILMIVPKITERRHTI